MANSAKIIEIKGTDPEAAFRETQLEARHLYGNSGRTGTIADADGCIVVSGPALLPWDGRRAAQQLLRDGHASAGGPVFLLRLADPKRTRTVKAVTDITGMDAGAIDDAIDAAVRERLPDPEWGIVGIEARGARAEGDGRKGQLRSKVLIAAGEGPKITKYVIKLDRTGEVVREVDTLAEAKTLLKTWLNAEAAPMHVVAETRREGGPLLSGKLSIIKQTVALTGTVGTPNGEPNGTYLAAAIFSNGA